MEPTNQPQVKLKGIEYLLLAIQSDPGKSQRHYLRRLYQYKHGVPSHNNGGTSVFLNTSCGNRYPHYGYAYKSKCSVMKLTLSGHERANKVREKLGLDPINLLDGAPSHANWV